jgi:uncharacterized membrane protein
MEARHESGASVRSERVIDLDWAPARVFAVLSDPHHLRDWSTLIAPADASRAWANGDDLALRWSWRGRDELVTARLELGDDPFTVRWEGKTDDGTRFELRHDIAARERGSRVDVVIDVEPASSTSAVDDGSLQRVLDHDVERMTARLFALIDRYDARVAPTAPVLPEVPEVPEQRPEAHRANVTTLGRRPLHRTIAPIALALFALTLVADMWYSLHERAAVARDARALAIAAAVYALLAGAVGVADLTRNAPARRTPIAWLHGAGNVVVITLAIVNAARRIDDPRAAIDPWGLVASSVIVALVTLTWFAGRAAAARTSGVPLDAAGVEAGSGEQRFVAPGPHREAQLVVGDSGRGFEP